MTKQEYISRLKKYLSPEAAGFAATLLLNEKSLQLVIARSRKSKFGDYRPPRPGQPFHKITINHDLAPVPFFITLLHEYAHYQVYLSIKNEESPHGEAWKNTFRMLLRQALNENIFPIDLEASVVQCYFKRENIASGMCKELLSKTKDGNPPVLVSDLPENSIFLLQKKIFIKGKKLRTRYECMDLSNKKKYRVHQDASVDHVYSADEIKRMKAS